MITRYIDKGSAKITFLQEIKFPISADTVYSAIKNFLTDKTTIHLTKMTSFNSGGPSVMEGKKNGVFALLK